MRYDICNICDYSNTQYQEMYRTASHERRELADKFRYEDDRKRCLCADMLVRRMLSEVSGTAPENITFTKEARGKPHASVPFDFNLSHSGEYVLCCVSNAPCGADIEQIKPFRAGLVARFCSDSEATFIWGGDKPDSDTVQDTDICRRFYTVWTAKEAYVKMTGTGISVDLKSIIYNPDTQTVCGIPLTLIDAPEGYIACMIKAPD